MIRQTLRLSFLLTALAAAGCAEQGNVNQSTAAKRAAADDDDEAGEAAARGSKKKKKATGRDDDSGALETDSKRLGGDAATGPTGDGPLQQGGDAPRIDPTVPPPAGIVGAEALATGCYRIEGGGYWSNGQGHSCVAPPAPFLAATCGTNDFNALTPRGDHGANVVDGGCWLQMGCYRIGGGGYWSNGQGRSCIFLGHRMPNHCNGMTVAQFAQLPELPHHWGNQLDGACQGSEAPPPEQPLAAGCYRVGGGGYWSNGQGRSCAAPPAPFLASQCGTNDFNALTARSDHGSNVVDGGCWLRAGCYRIGGGGYWSNGQGHSCVFRGDRMAAHCGFGVDRFTELPALDSHWGNALDGACAGS